MSACGPRSWRSAIPARRSGPSGSPPSQLRDAVVSRCEGRLAPAKVNLTSYLGPLRDDGRHELVQRDAVDHPRATSSTWPTAKTTRCSCADVDGPNLAAERTRRVSGGDGLGRAGPADRDPSSGSPWRPGMGGGSADAAAALRLLARRSGLGDGELLHDLACALGSDVAGQLRPGRVLVRGAGERVEALPDPAPFGVLVVPSPAMLVDRAVFREADRLGLPRSAAELASARTAREPRGSTTSRRRRSRSSPRSTAALERARARRGARRVGLRLGSDGDRPVRRPARSRRGGRRRSRAAGSGRRAARAVPQSDGDGAVIARLFPLPPLSDISEHREQTRHHLSRCRRCAASRPRRRS